MRDESAVVVVASAVDNARGRESERERPSEVDDDDCESGGVLGPAPGRGRRESTRDVATMARERGGDGGGVGGSSGCGEGEDESEGEGEGVGEGAGTGAGDENDGGGAGGGARDALGRARRPTQTATRWPKPSENGRREPRASDGL